jgi:excisionase family DNA binding protein
MAKQILTIKQCCHELSFSRKFIQKAIDTGELKASNLGTGSNARWRIKWTDIEAWLERRSNTAEKLANPGKRQSKWFA